LFARLLALVCLSIIGPSLGRSEPVGPTERKLVVYLKGGVNVDANQRRAMTRELARLMATAHYQVEVVELNAQTRTEQDIERLVVLELRGECSANPAAAISTGPSNSLASSAVIDGHVLPFATMHCGVLNRLLAAANRSPAESLREDLYGRSIGRIVAHELYHILADEVGHEQVGVAKACFRLSDLLTDSFSFEEAALLKLRPQPTYLSRLGGGGSWARARSLE
jgi:hypothetical protein